MSDTFRKEYRELTEVEKISMINIKQDAEIILAEMNKAVPGEERSEKSRCMNLARTKLEETVMWAVKGITL